MEQCGILCVPSDSLSVGRQQQQHSVLKKVPGLSSFANRHVTVGSLTSNWWLFINKQILHFILTLSRLTGHIRPKRISKNSFGTETLLCLMGDFPTSPANVFEGNSIHRT
ncbi:hypothetical protein NPIL_314481 [Nephila pilipes]|uniref:Uncharacterized protein n=1 Tax=Nephila pilipes TaxID=299642 RepID=A0A8X6PFX0_NEPPI|nr:hypothetical protein NPIL_314481 [Nephila pilipes]